MARELYISKNDLLNSYYVSDKKPDEDERRKDFRKIDEVRKYLFSDNEVRKLRERGNLNIYLDVPSEDRKLLKPALEKFRKAKIFRARK